MATTLHRSLSDAAHSQDRDEVNKALNTHSPSQRISSDGDFNNTTITSDSTNQEDLRAELSHQSQRFTYRILAMEGKLVQIKQHILWYREGVEILSKTAKFLESPEVSGIFIRDVNDTDRLRLARTALALSDSTYQQFDFAISGLKTCFDVFEGPEQETEELCKKIKETNFEPALTAIEKDEMRIINDNIRYVKSMKNRILRMVRGCW